MYIAIKKTFMEIIVEGNLVILKKIAEHEGGIFIQGVGGGYPYSKIKTII